MKLLGLPTSIGFSKSCHISGTGRRPVEGASGFCVHNRGFASHQSGRMNHRLMNYGRMDHRRMDHRRMKKRRGNTAVGCLTVYFENLREKLMFLIAIPHHDQLHQPAQYVRRANHLVNPRRYPIHRPITPLYRVVTVVWLGISRLRYRLGRDAATVVITPVRLPCWVHTACLYLNFRKSHVIDCQKDLRGTHTLRRAVALMRQQGKAVFQTGESPRKTNLNR